MKKNIILGALLAIAVAATTSCNSCKQQSKEADEPRTEAEVYHDYDGVVQDFTAGTAHIQALHRQTMFSLLGNDEYEWRNTRVLFNEPLTDENIDFIHITDVNDVFYYWDKVKGPMVQYINTNVLDGTQIPFPINDVWIEDDNLEDKPVKLSCEDALQRIKEWNGILPEDCNFMTLRLPIGPVDCNPQWVFGDVYNVIFIDALTGEISETNPAFKKP